MKKLILLSSFFILACNPPKFLVVSKTPTDNQGNCLLGLNPLNKKAEKFSYVKTAYVDCWDYNVGDTLKLTRREFTNY